MLLLLPERVVKIQQGVIEMIDSKLLAELADLISHDASADLLAGLGGSNAFPSIGLNGTRFMD